MDAESSEKEESPYTCPNGWVDLKRAFVRFIMRATGSSLELKAGKFPLDVDVWPDADMSPDDFKIGNIDWGRLRRLYAREAAWSFGSAARAGTLKTAYARKGGGELIAMKRAWWVTDDPLFHFKRWGLNPDPESMFDLTSAVNCWIFIESESLRRLGDELHAWKEAVPHSFAEEIERDSMQDVRLTGFPVRLERYGDGPVRLSAPGFPIFDRRMPVAAIGTGEEEPASADVAGPIRSTGARPPHRPKKYPAALAILARRFREGTVRQSRAEEANKIIGEWIGADPPAPKGVKEWIAQYHDQGQWQGGKIINGELLAIQVERALAAEAEKSEKR